MNNKQTTTMVDKWVINIVVLLLVGVFVSIVLTVLALAWNQVVYHSGESTSFASEFTGILNSIILISIGVFFSSVIGKIFGVKQEEMQKSVEQSVSTSKTAGLEKVVEIHEKLEKSPDSDSIS